MVSLSLWNVRLEEAGALVELIEDGAVEVFKLQRLEIESEVSHGLSSGLPENATEEGSIGRDLAKICREKGIKIQVSFCSRSEQLYSPCAHCTDSRDPLQMIDQTETTLDPIDRPFPTFRPPCSLLPHLYPQPPISPDRPWEDSMHTMDHWANGREAERESRTL